MSGKHNPRLLEQIRRLHRQLGIPADYAARHRLEPCAECRVTVSIGHDIFGREQHMARQAAEAWEAMQTAAAGDGIELQVVSAYRSIDYQAGIIRRKLESAQDLADILRTSAAPGFSEHHTGRALDLTTTDFEPLETCFEDSSAFAWLQENAADFGFRMSFPRGNPHGLCYEPWHWCWMGPA